MKYFTIAGIFKNEELYIGDWINYHLGLGCEHMYLYNNDSPDRSAEIANDIGKSKVTVTACPGHPVQHVAYEHCLKRQQWRDDARWILFLDVDEYLVPRHPIHTLLKEYERESALCPHWVLFGSNGHADYSPFPVPVRFVRSQSDVNRHVKSIINPRRTRNWVTAHRFTHDACPVDENHTPIAMTDSIPQGGTINQIYIAHYFTKSRAEFNERRSRPRPDTGEYRYNLEEAFTAHDRNDIENLDVLNLWNQYVGER